MMENICLAGGSFVDAGASANERQSNIDHRTIGEGRVVEKTVVRSLHGRGHVRGNRRDRVAPVADHSGRVSKGGDVTASMSWEGWATAIVIGAATLLLIGGAVAVATIMRVFTKSDEPHEGDGVADE